MGKQISGVVSVVVSGGPERVDVLVARVRALAWPPHLVEFVIVGDAPRGDYTALAGLLPGTLAFAPTPADAARSALRNAGARAASGEYLAFVDAEIVPGKEWIRAAVDGFASGQDIVAIACPILENGTVRFAGSTIDAMGIAVTFGQNSPLTRQRTVLFADGSAVFVRADAFGAVGGYDEEQTTDYADVDLGWRLTLAGGRVMLQPRSAVERAAPPSSGAAALLADALRTLATNLDDRSLNAVDPTGAARRAVSAGARRRAHRSRRRPDREVLLMGAIPLGTAVAEQHPFETVAVAAAHLGLRPALERGRRHVLVITGDPLGTRMAGPAIRAWNIATVLSADNDVRLVSTSSADLAASGFTVAVAPSSRPASMTEHEDWADVIILQGHALESFPVLESTRKVLVVDVYDPLHLEQLEQGKDLAFARWVDQVFASTDALDHQLRLGDFFLCASERQRDFWLGQLAGLGRVNPSTYSKDSSLESLVAVAPFGMPSAPPETTASAVRGVIKGIDAGDKVVIWAGGIYNWFDPETLVAAVDSLSRRRPDIRLLFMGGTHPNPDIPEMAALVRSRRLAESLGALGTTVFFNENWVPYDERQNYLMEADLGVSTHFEHVETRFSFRTRILDYLWAGLPIVSTEGDPLGDLVALAGLGIAVPERDQAALESAIERMLYDTAAAGAARDRVAALRPSLYWEAALAPLVEFCRDPSYAADRSRDTRERLARARSGRLLSAAARRRNGRVGARRDIDRVLFYLRNGGPRAIVERLRVRRGRQSEGGR